MQHHITTGTNICTWDIFACVEQHMMHDVGVVNDGCRADDVVVSVIW